MSTNVEKSFNTMNLPTWQEIYDIYKSEKFVYDYFANPNPEMDPYWKIPKDLVGITLLTNYINYAYQMNEDGRFDNIKLPREYTCETAHDKTVDYIVNSLGASLISNPSIKTNSFINRGNRATDVYDLEKCKNSVQERLMSTSLQVYFL